MMNLLETAVSCGVTPKEFWSMTPAMVGHAIHGYYKSLNLNREETAYKAWLFGLYNRAAYHAKNYPDRPTHTQKAEAKKMSEQQMKAVMRGLAHRNKKGR